MLSSFQTRVPPRTGSNGLRSVRPRNGDGAPPIGALDPRASIIVTSNSSNIHHGFGNRRGTTFAPIAVVTDESNANLDPVANASAIMQRVQSTEIKPTPEEYQRILSKKHNERTYEDVVKLAMLTKGVKFFGKLGADVTVSLAKVMDILLVPQGERVFSQGDYGDKFYICISGKVAIVKELPLAPGEDEKAGWQPPPRIRKEGDPISEDEEEEEDGEKKKKNGDESDGEGGKHDDDDDDDGGEHSEGEGSDREGGGGGGGGRRKSRSSGASVKSKTSAKSKKEGDGGGGAESVKSGKSGKSAGKKSEEGQSQKSKSTAAPGGFGDGDTEASEKKEGEGEGEGEEEEGGDDDDDDDDANLEGEMGKKITPQERSVLQQLSALRAKIKRAVSNVKDLQLEGNSESLENEQQLIRRLREERMLQIQLLKAMRERPQGAIQKIKMVYLVGLNAGDTFGEIALESTDCQRTATVIAETDSRFVTIQKEDYDRVLRHVMEQKRQQDVDFLRTVSCFSSWSTEQLGALRPLMATVNFTHGTYICKEGEKSQHLYILRSGRVRVTRKVTPQVPTKGGESVPGSASSSKGARIKAAAAATREAKIMGEAVDKQQEQQQEQSSSEAGKGGNGGGGGGIGGAYVDPFASRNNKEIQLAVLGPGNVFGETSVLRALPCSESIVVDSGLVQVWTLSKVDVFRKFDPNLQASVLKEADCKRAFHHRRIETVITTMLHKAKDDAVRRRGDILIAFPPTSELQRLARMHPVHLTRSRLPPRSQTVMAGSMAWAARSTERPATALGTSSSTKEVSDSPAPPLRRNASVIAIPKTSGGGFSFITEVPESLLEQRKLNLSSWDAPEPHSVNLSNRLSPLMLGPRSTLPHFEFDVDLINANELGDEENDDW